MKRDTIIAYTGTIFALVIAALFFLRFGVAAVVFFLIAVAMVTVGHRIFHSDQ